jgi:hypothetical protein
LDEANPEQSAPTRVRVKSEHELNLQVPYEWNTTAIDAEFEGRNGARARRKPALAAANLIVGRLLPELERLKRLGVIQDSVAAKLKAVRNIEALFFLQNEQRKQFDADGGWHGDDAAERHVRISNYLAFIYNRIMSDRALLITLVEEEPAPAPSAVAADAPAASSSAALPRNVDEAVVYVQTQLGDRAKVAESLVRRRIEQRGMADWTNSRDVKANLDAIVARILLDAGHR